MKLKLLSFIFLLSCFSQLAISQPYQSLFGTVNTSWNVFVEYNDGASTLILNTTGDTILNGLNYKTFLYSHYFLREDSTSGKAWIKHNSGSDTLEYLLMDLSLSVGDSFLLDYGNPWKDSLVIVDSVYFIDSLKFVQFNYTFRVMGQNDVKFTFIEGTGPNTSLFYRNTSNVIPYLLCAYKDSVRVYANTAFDGKCYVEFLGTNELTKKVINWEIHPNPFTSYTTIEVDKTQVPEYTLTIRNIFGQTVRTIQHHNTADLVIQKEDLPPGIYYFSIESKKEFVASGKVVIN